MSSSAPVSYTHLSEAGKKIYQTNLYHYAGTGHLAVDYARLMRLGFDGLLEQAKQKLAALDMHDPEFCTKREFYQAVIIMHLSLIHILGNMLGVEVCKF